MRQDEPVIPETGTLTIGIVPISALGIPINDEYVFQANIFAKQTDKNMQELVDKSSMISIISSENGFFQHSEYKRKILLINQCESDHDFNIAHEIINQLPQKFKNGLERIIIGSIRESEFSLAYCKEHHV